MGNVHLKLDVAGFGVADGTKMSFLDSNDQKTVGYSALIHQTSNKEQISLPFALEIRAGLDGKINDQFSVLGGVGLTAGLPTVITSSSYHDMPSANQNDPDAIARAGAKQSYIRAFLFAGGRYNFRVRDDEKKLQETYDAAVKAQNDATEAVESLKTSIEIAEQGVLDAQTKINEAQSTLEGIVEPIVNSYKGYVQDLLSNNFDELSDNIANQSDEESLSWVLDESVRSSIKAQFADLQGLFVELSQRFEKIPTFDSTKTSQTIINILKKIEDIQYALVAIVDDPNIDTDDKPRAFIAFMSDLGTFATDLSLKTERSLASIDGEKTKLSTAMESEAYKSASKNKNNALVSKKKYEDLLSIPASSGVPERGLRADLVVAQAKLDAANVALGAKDANGEASGATKALEDAQNHNKSVGISGLEISAQWFVPFVGGVRVTPSSEGMELGGPVSTTSDSIHFRNTGLGFNAYLACGALKSENPGEFGPTLSVSWFAPQTQNVQLKDGQGQVSASDGGVLFAVGLRGGF